MWVKILKWFFLSFLISLLPFAASALTLMIHAKPIGGFDGLSIFWEHGEMCLISIALAAAGIGDIASSNMHTLREIKIAVMLLSVCFLLATTCVYAEIAACLALNEPYNVSLTKHATPYLLIFSAITGFTCVLLSKEKQP